MKLQSSDISTSHAISEATNHLIAEKKKNEQHKFHNVTLQLKKDSTETELSASKQMLAEKEVVLGTTQRKNEELIARLTSYGKQEKGLLHQITIQEETRRKLHNKVMQLSGNIRVFIRVRPILEDEKNLLIQQEKNDLSFSYPKLCDRNTSSASSLSCEDMTKQIIVATEPFKDRGGLTQREKKWKFGFDHVFNPSHNQADVWEATEPLVQSCIDGHNVCLFAYGQTGRYDIAIFCNCITFTNTVSDVVTNYLLFLLYVNIIVTIDFTAIETVFF